MMRIANVIAFFVTATLAVILYSYKYETRDLDGRVSRLMQSIDQERQSISVLKAEWSHLKRPDRIERLARKHLGLGPIQPIQYVPADKMPDFLDRLPLLAQEGDDKAQTMERSVMDELVNQIVEQASPDQTGDKP